MRSLAAVIGLLTGLGVLSAQVYIFYERDFNSGVPTDWSLNTGDLGSATTGLYNACIVGADYDNPPLLLLRYLQHSLERVLPVLIL
jgi:hypothetical protein